MIPFQSYAQNQEDVRVRSILKEGGPSRFIDIGAADGRTFSNTYAWYQQGWKGVVVEASPYALPALLRLYGDDVEMDIVMSAIAPLRSSEVLRDFYVTPDLVSSLDHSHVNLWKPVLGDSDNRFRVMRTPVVAAEDLFAWVLATCAGVKHRLLSIDVEGSSIAVLEAAPLDALGVDVVIVEYDSRVSDVEKLAASRGFVVTERTSENMILVRKGLI